jgi:hypothetical protein
MVEKFNMKGVPNELINNEIKIMKSQPDLIVPNYDK